MSHDLVDLAVDGIAAYRLTRLVTADTITAGPRDAVIRWAYGRGDTAEWLTARGVVGADPDPGAWSEYAIDDDRAPKVATLLTCRWCASVHLGMLVVCMRRLFPRQWTPIATVLVLSAASALLARLED